MLGVLWPDLSRGRGAATYVVLILEFPSPFWPLADPMAVALAFGLAGAVAVGVAGRGAFPIAWSLAGEETVSSTCDGAGEPEALMVESLGEYGGGRRDSQC